MFQWIFPYMARMPSFKRRPPPSWILILALALVFFWMNNLPTGQRELRFGQMKVSTIDGHRYCDLGAVLAWMSLDHQGVDTRFECPTCPCFPNPMNYGAGVLWLGRLGLFRITPQGVSWAGPLVIVLFLASLAFVLTDAALWQTLYCAPLLFSPPIFLALERANLDIAIFSLLVLAAVLEFRLRAPWGYAVVLAAGALKYFPFAAGAAFLRSTRRGWTYFAGFCAAFALFVWITRGYIITAHQPDVWRLGWGYSVVFPLLPGILQTHGIAMRPWSDSRMFVLLALAAALMLAAAWTWRRPLRAFLGPHRSSRTLFLIGAILYAALFVTSGNYEYRSVFILLLLPLLFRMSQPSRPLAWCGLVLVFAAFLLSWFRGNDWLFLAHQAAYWLLLLFCGTLSFAAAFAALSGSPEWKPADAAGPAAKWLAAVLIAAVPVLYWLNRPTHSFAPGNLIANPEFSPTPGQWTLGTSGPLGCRPAAWSKSAGYPNGGIVLNSCGDQTSNPFAAQRVANLTPGAAYVLTFDWAAYKATGVYGAGTGKSFAVFIDQSGAPPSPSNDIASTPPAFLGERLDSAFETAPPITFTAAGTSATIYFEAELDPRTPGGPSQPTDVAYSIDNIDLRLKAPPNR